MSKRELEATQEGKELLIIEELSQEFEHFFKEVEHMRRENYLFESYFTRLEAEQSKSEEEEKRRGKERRREERKGASTLTPQEKYQIAQQEAEALKRSIEMGRIKSDLILQTLRAVLEETDMVIAEIKKDAYDFQREVLMGGENSRTGNIEAERIQRFFKEKEKQKRALLQKYRGKKSTLIAQIAKTASQIAKKEEMGDELKFIDFHQLQIENKKYVKEIQEKNQKLLDSKISSGKIAAELLEAKKRLARVVNDIGRLQKEIGERNKLTKQLQSSKGEHQGQRNALNDRKRNLLTQAEQMKSPNNTTDIPDVTALHTDNGVRIAEKERREAALREEEFVAKDIDSDSSLREGQTRSEYLIGLFPVSSEYIKKSMSFKGSI